MPPAVLCVSDNQTQSKEARTYHGAFIRRHPWHVSFGRHCSVVRLDRNCRRSGISIPHSCGRSAERRRSQSAQPRTAVFQSRFPPRVVGVVDLEPSHEPGQGGEPTRAGKWRSESNPRNVPPARMSHERPTPHDRPTGLRLEDPVSLQGRRRTPARRARSSRPG